MNSKGISSHSYKYHTGDWKECNKVRKRNESHPDSSGRSIAIAVQRWHECLWGKFKIIYKNATRINKWVHQDLSSEAQDEHEKNQL